MANLQQQANNLATTDTTNEPIDLFAATLSSSIDLSSEQDLNMLTKEDLSLAERDKYKENAKIKEVFQNENGVFDEKKFDKAYDNVLKLYNQVTDVKTASTNIAATYLDMTSLFPSGDKTQSFSGQYLDNTKLYLSKVDNYSGITKGLGGLNQLTEPNTSIYEAAQTNAIFDSNLGEFRDKTADEYTLFRDTKGFFTEKFALAKYEEDIKDKAGNILHKKGEPMMHEGKPYYRTIKDGEDTANLEVLSYTDRLTPEGSIWNKYDFFDSDDIKKSTIGTVAKFAAEMIPYFIPYVNVAYTSAKVGRELVDVGGELVRAFGNFTDDNFSESDLNKQINNIQGYIKQSRGGMSQYGKENFFSLENLLGQTSAVVDQLYGIRGISKLPKYVSAIDQQGILAATTGLSRNLAGLRGGFDTVKSSNRIAGLASQAMSNLYFAGVAAKPMAEQARALGLDPDHSSMLFLGTMGAMSALYKFAPFDWMTKEFGLDDVGKHINTKLKEGVIPNLSLYNGLSQSAKTSKAILDNNRSINSVIDNLFKQGGTTALATASGVEALEEVTEEGIQDGIKYFYNSMTDAGLIKKNKKAGSFKFDNALERYGASAMGGALGGAVFKAVPKFEALTFGVDPNDPLHQDLNWLLVNGYKDEVYKQAEAMYKQGYVDKNLSTEYTLDSEGNKVFKTTDTKEETANYKIHQAVLSMLDTQTSLIQSANMLGDDEIANQYTDAMGRIVNAKTESFLRDDHNKITDDIFAVDAEIKKLDEQLLTSDNPDSIKAQRIELDKKRDKLFIELNSIYNGSKVPDYLLQGLYIIRPDILEKGGLKTVDTIAGEEYSMPFDMLSSEQKSTVRSKFIDKVKAGDNSAYKNEVKDALNTITNHESDVFIPKLKEFSFSRIINKALEDGVFDSIVVNEPKELSEKELKELEEAIPNINSSEDIAKLSDNVKRELLYNTSHINKTLLKEKLDENKVVVPDIVQQAWGQDLSELDVLGSLIKSNPNEYLVNEIDIDVFNEKVQNSEVIPESQKKKLLESDNLFETLIYLRNNYLNHDLLDRLEKLGTILTESKSVNMFGSSSASSEGVVDTDFEDVVKYITYDLTDKKVQNRLLYLGKIDKNIGTLKDAYTEIGRYLEQDKVDILELVKDTKLKESYQKFTNANSLVDTFKDLSENEVDHLFQEIDEIITKEEEVSEKAGTSYMDDNNKLLTVLNNVKLNWANIDAAFTVNPIFATQLNTIVSNRNINPEVIDMNKYNNVLTNNYALFQYEGHENKIDSLLDRIGTLYTESEKNKRNYINDINKQNAVNFKIQYNLFTKLKDDLDLDFKDINLIPSISVKTGEEKLFIDDVQQRKTLYNEIIGLYSQVYDKFSKLDDDKKQEIRDKISKDYDYFADGNINVIDPNIPNKYITEYKPNYAIQFFNTIVAKDPIEFYGKLKELLDDENVYAPVYAQEFNLLAAYNYINGNLNTSELDTYLEEHKKLSGHDNIIKQEGVYIKAPAGGGKTEMIKNLIKLSSGKSLVATEAGTPKETLAKRLENVYEDDVLEFDELMMKLGFTKEDLQTLMTTTDTKKDSFTVNGDFKVIDGIVNRIKNDYLKEREKYSQIIIDEATWLPGPYLNALSRLAQVTKTKAPVYLGDNVQQGFTTGGDSNWGDNISNSVIFGTPDVDSVLRTGVREVKDVQTTLRDEAKKIVQANRNKKDYSPKRSIPTYYDRNTKMGTLVTSNPDDSIFDNLNLDSTAIYVHDLKDLPPKLAEMFTKRKTQVYSKNRMFQSAEYDNVIFVDSGELATSDKKEFKYSSLKRQYEHIYTISTRARKGLIYLTSDNLFAPTKDTIIPDVIPDLSEVAKVLRENKKIELEDIEGIESTEPTPTDSTEAPVDSETSQNDLQRAAEISNTVIGTKGTSYENLLDFTKGNVRMYSWFLPKKLITSTDPEVVKNTKEYLRRLQHYLLTRDSSVLTKEDKNRPTHPSLDSVEYVFTAEPSNDETNHIDFGSKSESRLKDKEPIISLSAKITRKNGNVGYIPLAVFPNHQVYELQMAEALGITTAELESFINSVKTKMGTSPLVELTSPKTTPAEALKIPAKNFKLTTGRLYTKPNPEGTPFSSIVENAKTLDEFKKQHPEIAFSDAYMLAKSVIEGLEKGKPYVFYSFDKSDEVATILKDPNRIAKELRKDKPRIGVFKADRTWKSAGSKLRELVSINNRDSEGAQATMFLKTFLKPTGTQDPAKDFSNELVNVYTNNKAKFIDIIRKNVTPKSKEDLIENLNKITTEDVTPGTVFNFTRSLTKKLWGKLVPKGTKNNKLIQDSIVKLFIDLKDTDQLFASQLDFDNSKSNKILNITKVKNPEEISLLFLDYISRPSFDIPFSVFEDSGLEVPVTPDDSSSQPTEETTTESNDPEQSGEAKDNSPTNSETKNMDNPSDVEKDNQTEGETVNSSTAFDSSDLDDKSISGIFESLISDSVPNKSELIKDAIKYTEMQLTNKLIFDPSTGKVIKKSFIDC